MERKCKECSVDISNRSLKAKFCSQLCRKRDFNRNNKDKVAASKVKYHRKMRELARVSGKLAHQPVDQTN